MDYVHLLEFKKKEERFPKRRFLFWISEDE